MLLCGVFRVIKPGALETHFAPISVAILAQAILAHDSRGLPKTALADTQKHASQASLRVEVRNLSAKLKRAEEAKRGLQADLTRISEACDRVKRRAEQFAQETMRESREGDVTASRRRLPAETKGEQRATVAPPTLPGGITAAMLARVRAKDAVRASL